MKIGIIGAGMIGSTAARLFVSAGHEIAIANSRGPASLAGLVAELGPAARALDVAGAARWADVLLLAVPWRKPEALPPSDSVAGKIVIDAMNPYGPDGSIADLGSGSSSEETRRRLPAARLVKAFNTIWYRHLAERGRPDAPVDDRHAIFVAGDDEDAKRIVMGLIEGIGFGPVDTGSLADGGRRQQPDTALYNKILTVREARALLAGRSR
ncbi:MAG TPA: NAD(P)-binding domain-containing protein [Vicinamibacterales bacterium]|nr:NAD(P)-binding domain-containing protein [Vicinamibacterales bacterium]